jgi:hypothetical protein
MGIGTIDFNLFENWEFGVELGSDELQDLLVSARLLTHELIAREGQYLQALDSKLLVHLGEEFVVGGSEASLTGYIDNQDGFLSFVGREVNYLAVDVLDLEIEERVGELSFDGFTAALMDKSLCYSSHK